MSPILGGGRTVVAGGILLTFAHLAAIAAADDVVFLKPKAAGESGARLPGEVIDYTGANCGCAPPATASA